LTKPSAKFFSKAVDFYPMRNFLLLFLVLVLFAFSQTAAAQSAAKILSQAEKALGGKKALQTIRSRQKKGTITRVKDGASGVYLTQTAKPNFYNERFDFDGFETESGFNGKSGWRRDSREGLRTFTGAASRDFAAETAYRNNLWLEYKKEKAKIVFGGQKTFDGKTANLINLTTAKGVLIKLYFDAKTDFLIREEISNGEEIKIFDYADFRPTGKIQEPFSIKITNGENIYEIKLDQIIHNPNVARAAFDFPKISGEPLPDIPALLSELQANEDRVENILENYSFTQKTVRRELGKDGVLREIESETYQLSFYKGSRIRRLIEKNGKPLTEKEQKDEDREVEKRVAEIEKKIAKKEAKAVEQSAKGTPDDESRRISIAEVLRASRLVNPRRERFRERDVIVFDFEPNPDFDYKNAQSFLKFFGKTAGVMWIDEKDKQVARIEAVLFDNYKVGGGLLANLKKGASFTLEQERVNDEIWLPSTADINLSVKVLLVKGININQVIKSSNYRRFETEVKDARIDTVKENN
jgi:hypothetical protein